MSYVEDWEEDSVNTKNTAHEYKLNAKYQYVYCFDADEHEVRRILHVTWEPGRRGRSAQHVVVTQLVERNSEIVDAEEECTYCINELLHDMIQAALPPYNGEREIVLAPPNI